MKGSTANERDKVAIPKKRIRKASVAADGKSSVSRSVSKSVAKVRASGVSKTGKESKPTRHTNDARSSRVRRAGTSVSRRVTARVQAWLTSGRAVVTAYLVFIAVLLWIANPDWAVGAITGYIAGRLHRD